MRNLHSFLLTFLLILGFTSARADIVKLKNGTKYEGKITLKTPDMVKIEVTITDKIKETKTIAIGDISDIIVSAPDDVAFARIQNFTPTGSLITSEQYRSMLTTGPEDFLSKYAGSKHKEKVEAIKKTLEEELDKVERGNIKLEGEWFSPQDRIDFPELIESKIVLFRMKNSIGGGRYLNNISAMREFEKLESKYFGTPAFAEGVTLAQQILPTLGQQVKGLRRDVDVKNAQWEASKNALGTVDRQRVEQARNREESQFAAWVAADKKAKIKWTRLNPRSPTGLDSYLQFAGAEYQKVKAYDPSLIKERAEALLEVDQMIKDGDIDRAKIKLASASAMPVSQGKTSGKSTSKGSSSYSKSLLTKLNLKVSDRKDIAKAEADAKKSESLTADLKNNQKNSTSDLLSSASDATAGKGKPESTSNADDFDLLAGPVKKKEPEKKAAPKKKTTKKPRAPREDLPPPKKPFPFHLLGIGLAVLAGAGVAVMKVLGIGGKSKDGEDDE